MIRDHSYVTKEREREMRENAATTLVEVLGSGDGSEIEFDPARLGLIARTPEL